MDKWIDEPECPHKPGLADKARYYFHIVWGHQPAIWGEGKDPEFVQTMCLTYDWVEYGTACPPCIRAYDREFHVANYFEDEEW